MIISGFTEKRLARYRAECNFTPEELAFFNLRACDRQIIEICRKMNISKSRADSLSRAVRRKIKEVDEQVF